LVLLVVVVVVGVVGRYRVRRGVDVKWEIKEAVVDFKIRRAKREVRRGVSSPDRVYSGYL